MTKKRLSESVSDMVDDTTLFSARLTAVREAYGFVTGRPHLPRATFAAELGLAREAYRRYERGEVEPPMAVLASIRRLTGISLDYLVTDLDHGIINAAELSDQCYATAAERIRWVRELFQPDIALAAKDLSVSVATLRRWENGLDIMPEAAQELFAYRFRVSTQYLSQGLPVVSHMVFLELRRLHPELWRSQPQPLSSQEDDGEPQPFAATSSGLPSAGLPAEPILPEAKQTGAIAILATNVAD